MRWRENGHALRGTPGARTTKKSKRGTPICLSGRSRPRTSFYLSFILPIGAIGTSYCKDLGGLPWPGIEPVKSPRIYRRRAAEFVPKGRKTALLGQLDTRPPKLRASQACPHLTLAAGL